MFTGRMNRKQFLLPPIFLIVLPYTHFAWFLLLEASNSIYVSSSYDGEPGILFLPILLFPFLLLSTTIKRLHDIGWSGWFSALMIIPLVNLLFILLLLIKKGQKEANKYGQIPMRQSYILFWVFLSFLFVAYVIFVNFRLPSFSVCNAPITMEICSGKPFRLFP